MQVDTEETVIIQKTKELCQAILDQPQYQAIRRHVDAFLTDEQAKSQYQIVAEKGDQLQQKQQLGVPLSGEEVADYEKHRDLLVNNPVAKGFLEAQQEMHKVQESVGQYVAKTFELGRLPNHDDFASGSCGHGCGCH